MFELKDRSAGGRTGIWTIGKKKVSTPNIAIVINPNKQIVSPKELEEEFGAELIITNAYIIKRSDNAPKIEKNGIHKFYDWEGPIYFDSGTFQMYSKGKAEIGPEETIDYQLKVGADVITPLDEFTLPTDPKDVAEKKLKTTLERISAALKVIPETRMFNVPVQGGLFLDLRKKAAQEASKINGVGIFSIGGIVPLMEQYRYPELIDIILTCKENLDPSKPVHAFGAGHPMIFPLLVAAGIDIFDSAAYALYASAGRYMTPTATKHLAELNYLPCSCPICFDKEPKDLDEKLLAKHNLYMTFAEIRNIKQAISENRLWEYVEQKSVSHPELMKAYRILQKHSVYLEKQCPVGGKKAFVEILPESRNRPELKRLEKITSKRGDFSWLGMNFAGKFSYVYPFSQSVLFEKTKMSDAKPKDALEGILEFQFGKNACNVLDESVTIETSKTGRLRHILKDGNVIGTVRANDSVFIPTKEGASLLFPMLKGKRVIAAEDSVPFIKQGKSAFCKYVLDATEDIRPGDEVFIVSPERKLIGFGTALMNRDEMLAFNNGIAVKVRFGID